MTSLCPTCGGRIERVTRIAQALIPRAVTSANARVVNVGATRWRYAKERAEWLLWVRTYLDLARGAERPRRVTFERRYTGRQQEMDKVNMASGLKPCLDALVTATVLVDDSPAWLDDRYEQRRVATKAEAGLLITVEEVA